MVWIIFLPVTNQLTPKKNNPNQKKMNGLENKGGEGSNQKKEEEEKEKDIELKTHQVILQLQIFFSCINYNNDFSFSCFIIMNL